MRSNNICLGRSVKTVESLNIKEESESVTVTDRHDVDLWLWHFLMSHLLPVMWGRANSSTAITYTTKRPAPSSSKKVVIKLDRTEEIQEQGTENDGTKLTQQPGQ